MIIEADKESALKVLPKEELEKIIATNASARRRAAIIAHALSRKMRRGSGRKKRVAAANTKQESCDRLRPAAPVHEYAPAVCPSVVPQFHPIKPT